MKDDKRLLDLARSLASIKRFKELGDLYTNLRSGHESDDDAALAVLAYLTQAEIDMLWRVAKTYLPVVQSIAAFTDYPIRALGDKSFEPAPIRACRVISYDGNKRALVIVDGYLAEIKAGYLYKNVVRADSLHKQDVPLWELQRLPEVQKE